MKTFKTILITLFVALSFASCTKDEDGQWIRYYKQPTGEGYVFVKHEDGTVTPYANKKDCLALEASGNAGSGLFDAFWDHTDIYSTDENGKFTCKFVRKIDRHDVQYYAFYFTREVIDDYILTSNTFGNWGFYYCVPDNFSENNLIAIDTFYITLKKVER